jgi:hypothetical protein
MYQYLNLRLALLYQKWIRFALIRKTFKFASEAIKVFEVLHLRGVISAYHFANQQIAFRKAKYQDARYHQERGLNTSFRKEQSTLNRFSNLSRIFRVQDIIHDTTQSLRLNDELIFRNASFADCLELYQYFRYFGDFRVAEFFREQALQASLREQKSIPYLLPNALNAALELGLPEVVLRLLRDKDTSTANIAHSLAAKSMAHALLGDLAPANQLWQADFHENDLHYREYIEGRSVAVVGPASPLDTVGPEIDTYDVVVRTNFRLDLNLPADLFGSRTDVSYYNHASWTTRRDGVLEAAKSLDWINLKGRNDDSLLRTLSPSFAGGSRVFFQADHLFFEGNPMAIPNIIFDLIRFSPSRIKLFCTSFYIAGNNYHPGYHTYSKPSVSVKVTSDSLRLHDPFSGFMLTQRLFQTNFISADSLGEGALNTSRSHYASRLNEVFGGWTLGNNNYLNINALK